MKMDPRFVLTLLALLWTTVDCVADPAPPPPQVPPGPPGFPIDGSLVLLIAMAILLGLYKLRNVNKKAMM